MSLKTPWQLVGRTVILFSGSRSIRSYWTVSALLREQLAGLNKEEVVLLQGEAYHGVDRLVRIFAKRNGWRCVGWPADWDNLGKRAGHVRNSAMLLHAHRLIAIWDSESKGTANAIKTCDTLKKPYEVHELPASPDWEDKNIADIARRKVFNDKARSKLLIRG